MQRTSYEKLGASPPGQDASMRHVLIILIQQLAQGLKGCLFHRAYCAVKSVLCLTLAKQLTRSPASFLLASHQFCPVSENKQYCRLANLLVPAVDYTLHWNTSGGWCVHVNKNVSVCCLPHSTKTKSKQTESSSLIFDNDKRVLVSQTVLSRFFGISRLLHGRCAIHKST